MDQSKSEPRRCERCQMIIEQPTGSAMICDDCYDQAANACCGDWIDAKQESD